jgi:biopolymer transport protein ExbD
MADIAFMLVIFFMLSTVFVSERGIHVTLPRAVSTKRLPKKNISHIWVSSEGFVSIDDNIVSMDHMNSIMARKVRTNPDLIISILMDKEGQYGVLSDAFEQLKEASALRVSLATLKEKGV